MAMIAPATTLPRTGLSGVATWIATVLLFVAASVACLAVAVLNQPYFDIVSGIVDAQGPEARGLLYSSWLLILAVPVVARRPRAFGLGFGSIGTHWRLVAGMLTGAAAITWSALAVVGPIPYSDASAFIEIVDVPVTEELLFRGVLFTALLAALRRIHPGGGAMIRAVAFDGLAFGLGHLANASALELDFVLAQSAFAAGLGTACAFVMARTGSLYPAIVLHATVNAVVVLA